MLLYVNATEKWTGMKNTGLKINLVFHTIRELKLSVTVLVFSVLNVSELTRRLTRSGTLKKQCMYR